MENGSARGGPRVEGEAETEVEERGGVRHERDERAERQVSGVDRLLLALRLLQRDAELQWRTTRKEREHRIE